jgi:hypothetical protein
VKPRFGSRWLLIFIGTVAGIAIYGSNASGITARLSSDPTLPTPAATGVPTFAPPSHTPPIETQQPPTSTPPSTGSGNPPSPLSGTMAKLHAIVESCAARGGSPSEIADCTTNAVQSLKGSAPNSGGSTGGIDTAKLHAAYDQCRAKLPNATQDQLKSCVMQAVGAGQGQS